MNSNNVIIDTNNTVILGNLGNENNIIGRNQFA